MSELRVFVERTKHTPTDRLVRIGEPDLFAIPPDIHRISVSCVFTWQRARASELADFWKDKYPHLTVQYGGPAFDDPGDGFIPGRFVRRGISISSRGCPERCAFCFVPKREGPLRLLPIAEGNHIQDNNVLAFPRDHFESLCRMLKGQHAIKFVGGLQASRLRDWQADLIRSLRIDEVWLAADSAGSIPALRRAVAMLKLGRKKTRCYVLIGYNGETLAKAETRLEQVWEAGCLPFAQLYRDPDDMQVYEESWRQLVRKWSRPAAIYASHPGQK